MGGYTSTPAHVYSTPVPGSKKPGQTAVYRNTEYMDQLIEGIPGQEVLGDIWRSNFKTMKDKAWLGRRVRGDRDEKGNWILKPEFEYWTWAQVEEKCNALGSGLAGLNLCPEIWEWSDSKSNDYKLKFAGIYAGNSREYVIVEGACGLYGITTVPIYDTLGEEACEHMYRETNMTTIFSTCNHVAGIINSIESGAGKLKNIVVMDSEELERSGAGKLLDEKKAAGVLSWHTMDEVMSKGRESPLPHANVKATDIYTFSYTSGTTSAPKGAMMSHRNIMSMLFNVNKMIQVDPIVHIAYLPLAHIFERVVMNLVVWKGGEYAIFNGNVMKLAEDLSILKPTFFVSVPRLYSRFYDKIKAKIANAGCFTQFLYNKALAAKQEKFRATGDMTHGMWDSVVFKGTKAVLGGRVQMAVTASAPIDGTMLEFLKLNFCCPIGECYGQTEGTGGEFATHPNDKVSGTVGGPLGVNEMKLVDVPEMKYTADDLDEQGLPCPRGEICVRGANVIPAYYKQQDKTDESIDSEGWLHSGDIGMLMPGTNALKVFDRKKNIFKLAQGEYVAPEKLEGCYKLCASIGDIFVYGDSFQASLVAIVNPDPEVIQKHAATMGLTGSFAELCANAEIKKFIQADMTAQEIKSKLKGFEKVRGFNIDAVTFVDAQLTTTSFKLKRHEAKEHYKDAIKKLYG